MKRATPKEWLWLASPFVAAVLTLALLPASAALQKEMATQQLQLSSQKEKLGRQLRQWQADAQTAQVLARTLPESAIARLLDPGDRKALAAQIEPLALSARLANISYVLSPAQDWDGGATFPGIRDATISALTIEADAPSDSDIYAFLKSLLAQPGRFEITSLTITPLREDIAARPAALNLRMKASLQWIANAQEKGGS